MIRAAGGRAPGVEAAAAAGGICGRRGRTGTWRLSEWREAALSAPGHLDPEFAARTRRDQSYNQISFHRYYPTRNTISSRRACHGAFV